jgi:hypothetical protein
MMVQGDLTYQYTTNMGNMNTKWNKGKTRKKAMLMFSIIEIVCLANIPWLE